MPDRQDRQREIDMNGRKTVDQLYSCIPAPFVVRTPMDAVNLEMGPRQEVQWLGDDAVRAFNFRNARP